MTVAALLNQAHAAGLSIELEGEALRVRGPQRRRPTSLPRSGLTSPSWSRCWRIGTRTPADCALARSASR